MTGSPQFTIVTPSFRNSEWLKLCIASVADQGVSLEHIVQDACSNDGTQDWLPRDSRVQAFIEKDQGMYDAVNRGLRRARGEILAYINCDEQYLPGALAGVWDYFQRNPGVEVAFAHAIVIDAEGRYLCERRALAPTRYHSWVSGNLSILTAATFYRRSVFERRGLHFNPQFRDVSDVLWVMSLLEHSVPLGVLDAFTSAFTDTGDNMNLKPNAREERARLLARAPRWARLLKPCIVAQYRWRRFAAGHYAHQAPYAYSVYTKGRPEMRTRFEVAVPTWRWRRRPVPIG